MPLSESIVPGDIIKCSHEELSTDVPHYFICLTASEDDIIFSVVLTSKIDNKIKYFKKYALPENQIVMVSPSDDNGLTVESCVSCRDVFDFSCAKVDQLSATGDLVWTGKIEDDYLEQIVLGLKDCELIERDVTMLLPDFQQD